MVSVLSLGITSCGDDDDNTSSIPSVTDSENSETNKNTDLIGWWTCYVDGSFGRNGGDKNYLAIHFVNDQVAVWYGGVTNKQQEGWIYALTINGERYYVDPEYKNTLSYYREKNTIITTKGWTWTILNGKIYDDSDEFTKNSSVRD